jgi:hypothetical protein
LLVVGLLLIFAASSCARTASPQSLWQADFANGMPWGWIISPSDWKNKPSYNFSVEKEGDTSFAHFDLDKPSGSWTTQVPQRSRIVTPWRLPSDTARVTNPPRR